MSIVLNHTKQLLASGELALGMGLRQARTVDIATIAKTCGYDWLFIDMEHNSMSVDTAAQIAMAGLASGATPIVRVPGHEHYHATRLLDAGAQGIVVPHIDTAVEAERVVSDCKYPPIGHRSMAGAMPQMNFKSAPLVDAAAAANEQTLVIVMLETPTAIANADAIAAVKGVDVLLMGTNDLCAEMGIHGQFGHAKVEEAYLKLITACHSHGKYPGMGGVYDQPLMEKYIGMGVQFILSGSDMSFLMAAAQARSTFIRGLGAKKAAPAAVAKTR